MREEEILNAIKALASSQGFYGRLYEKLINARDSDDEIEQIKYQTFINDLEEKNFKDTVDLVLYLET